MKAIADIQTTNEHDEWQPIVDRWATVAFFASLLATCLAGGWLLAFAFSMLPIEGW